MEEEKNMKKTFLWVMILVIVLAGAYVAYTILGEDYRPDDSVDDDISEERTKAPDFTVVDAEGNAVNLYDFIGKPLVVNFWASWCGPCRSEMPDFDEAYSEYCDKVIFMMINLADGRRETVQSGLEYVLEQGFSFPVYFDIGLEASLSYGITSYPTTIFIDEEGYFVTGYIGAINKEVLQEALDLLLD